MADWQNLSRQILAATDRKADAAARALDEYGEIILGESKDLCPTSPTNKTTPGIRKKTKKNPFYTGHPGDLRQSAAAEDVERSSTRIRKVLKYTAKHAAAVHERQQPAHGAALKAKHPDVVFNSINDRGQWKYLATPIIQNREKTVAHVAGEMSRA